MSDQPFTEEHYPGNKTNGSQISGAKQQNKDQTTGSHDDGPPMGEKADPFEALKMKVGAETAIPNLNDNWAILGVLPMQSFIAIYGAPGSGKSAIALDMSLHIVTGLDWCGNETEQGLVLYASLEGLGGFSNRVAAAKKHHNITDGEMAFFSSINVNLDLKNSETDRRNIIEGGKALMRKTGQPIRMVVIDTLNRAFGGGNENSPEDMGAVISNCAAIIRELECSVMLVHHSGKDVAMGMRGHSSLIGAVDTEIKIERKGAGRIMSISKQKEGDEGKQFGFLTEAVEVGITPKGHTKTAVVVKMKDADEIKKQSSQKPTGKFQKALMDALAQITAEPECKTNPAGTGWPEAGTKKIVSTEHLISHAKGKLPPPGEGEKDRRRDGINRALSSLTKSGTLCTNQDHVWNPKESVQ